MSSSTPTPGMVLFSSLHDVIAPVKQKSITPSNEDRHHLELELRLLLGQLPQAMKEVPQMPASALT